MKPRENATVGDPTAIANTQHPGRRRLLIAVAVVSVLAGGSYAAWQCLQDRVLQGPQYRLTADDIVVTAPPAWIRTDIRAEVLRDGSLDLPISILDPSLAERLHRAFALHPWVEKVERVAKRSPPRVEVQLVYRRPVCMVEVQSQGNSPGGLFPVDIHGILLPTRDFSPIEAARYPRLSGIQPTTEGPVGSPWGDDRVVGAAQIAAALADVWTEFQLRRIVPMNTGEGFERDAIHFELITASGERIHWGRAPGDDDEGLALAAKKIARLKQYFDEHGEWATGEESHDLDLDASDQVVLPPNARR